MTLSEFLGDVAQAEGGKALWGAMVFVMLKRPLDELISHALANGPYHRGRPSPWSHCFLLAEPYRGAPTKILDCTIRDPAGRIIWHTSLPETLEILFDATAGRGAGAVYQAQVSDYDDGRVTAHGVKWLAGLSDLERQAIVAEGERLRLQGIRYDLPGLMRELVRLLTGVQIQIRKSVL